MAPVPAASSTRARSRRRVAACAGAGVALILAALAGQGPGLVPRLAPVPEAGRSDEQRAIATEYATAGMPHLVAAYLHHPVLAATLLAHERYISTASTLPARHRELLALRASWLARSDYLWAHRSAAARRDGFSDDDLRRVARGPDAPGWDGFEATLVRAADELYVDCFVSDATWRALSARYDIAQLIDTVDTVGATVMHADAANSLGVEIEPGVADRRPTGIPYRPAASRTNRRLLGREPRIPPTPALNPDGTVRQSANVFRTFVRNPPADRVRGAINNHVNSRTTLVPRHRELLLMRIGVLCRTEYEYAAHSRIGRRLGMSDADVTRIVNGDGGSTDPVEDLLLRATNELYGRDAVSAETWAALARVLSAPQLLDLLIAVGDYRSTSMLINTAGVQLDANMADYRFPRSLR